MVQIEPSHFRFFCCCRFTINPASMTKAIVIMKEQLFPRVTLEPEKEGFVMQWDISGIVHPYESCLPFLPSSFN